MMRQKLLILSLVAASALAITSDANAQLFRAGVGGRNWGVGVGNGGVYGGYGGWGDGYYGGRGWGDGYYGGRGWGDGYYGGRGWGDGYGYSSGYSPSIVYSYPSYMNSYPSYDYGYAPSMYNSTPYYSSNQGYGTTQGYGMNQGYGQGYQSYYSDPSQNQYQNSATVTVSVPAPDAQVWFDNTPTRQQGMQRLYYSPPLESGSNYSYTIKARWTENGQTVDRQRKVQVQPGQSVNVDFRNTSGTGSNQGENLQTPRTGNETPRTGNETPPTPKTGTDKTKSGTDTPPKTPESK